MSLMDRDERGDHRIPILMNYLKLKITDSLYPFHDRHAVFRIELEYGDGAVKWVIYRELKDFVNLHAHYRVANLRQGVDKFPTFPKTSIPYLNWLKTERGSVGKADFTRAQRQALEDYLLKLIRATMFRPEANRLCKFLEISAMSLSLASRGGEQGKQGYLSILSSGASRRKPTGFHPLSWKKRHEPKWFIVRDSYVVATDDPASTEVYDVIMVDYTFELERPKRILRQGLNLVTGGNSTENLSEEDPNAPPDEFVSNAEKPQGHRGAGDPNDPSTTNVEGQRLKDSSNHTFYLKTSERKLRLVAKTERQQDQFIASIEKMLAKTIWAGRNRFDSFAPIRLNASAQWLIDGRDYYWSLSRAILLAKHKIYIHDWWLSPELYLRRPAALNEKWRLDRLLQRKAKEGVQIFVIVYKEVSNDFTPVDSNYTKTRLRSLHPNIHIQRSPSHTSTGTLLWSHHEKMCVVDETIGFMGGFDLCFGRWDTPGHVLVDDGPNVVFDPEQNNADNHTRENSQIWPGKDYCNQRVLDFHTLNKPEEDMYDRSKVPRQPWHDIGLQIIGQPARDLCRHFIQRWNFLLRTKNHTIKMPFLIPAPDFTPRQLQEQRITGTCEIQICRSVGPWSMGISHIEHSIQNAYIKAIQLSDHFVYIENQFFISSTEVEGNAIENKIGDALVSRILRAHSEGTPWRAVIVIPLVPGYPYPIDHSDAGSVRLIMECQYATICRGEKSIFARLRREGIDPDEYITFFGLRGWGKLGSGALTTEAVYIHAKAMIVDDRTVIIGSANINERSQRGDRDSELACIIRDTDMIDSTMAGKPYMVGRFAHTMRVRLMREHLGVDVDELEAEEGTHEDLLKKETKPEDMKEDEDAWDPDHQQEPHGEGKPKVGDTFHWTRSLVKSAAENTGSVISGAKEVTNLGLQKGTENVGKTFGIVEDEMEGATKEQIEDEETETDADRIVNGTKEGKGFASTVVPTLEEKVMAEGRPSGENKDQEEEVKEGENAAGRSITVKERKEGTTNKPPRLTEGDIEEDNPGKEDQRESKRSTVEEDAQRQLGQKTTQRNPDVDDTRKLGADDEVKERVEENSHETIRPLPPITETSTNNVKPHRIQDLAPPPDISKKPVINGRSSTDRLSVPSSYPPSPDAPSSDAGSSTDSPPAPPSSFDSRSRSQSTSQGSKTTLSSGPPETFSSKANETAVNRNKITSSLRRNLREKGKNVYSLPTAAPTVDPHGFSDPLVDSFYKDVWMAAAVRNTQAYRKVFRCVPDDLVQTWKQYREFQTWAERHNKAPKDVAPPGDDEPFSNPEKHQGVHGAGGGGSGGGAMGQGVNDPPPGETMHKINSRSGRARALSSVGSSFQGGGDSNAPKGRERSSTLAGEGHDHDEGFPAHERDQMEECLESMSGTLGEFLEAESAGGNFLFSKDRLPPLSIYD
ncbi:hypothetical protein BCR35DRAFT_316841 [Leucosporidium creatinivorum]|uniref:Phospholipase n=1 Tax=Leucosporidium creatinivorum TaxID=106004 RepID=A0A1Y2G2L1_9BASI|nr:hypothetical protein BCR35DRAFT_316841 [Leucosporidium creatinivorum]